MPWPCLNKQLQNASGAPAATGQGVAAAAEATSPCPSSAATAAAARAPVPPTMLMIAINSAAASISRALERWRRRRGPGAPAPIPLSREREGGRSGPRQDCLFIDIMIVSRHRRSASEDSEVDDQRNFGPRIGLSAAMRPVIAQESGRLQQCRGASMPGLRQRQDAGARWGNCQTDRAAAAHKHVRAEYRKAAPAPDAPGAPRAEGARTKHDPPPKMLAPPARAARRRARPGAGCSRWLHVR